MVNIWNLKSGQAIRIRKTFRDRGGSVFLEGTIWHFAGRNYVPYHSGHVVHFREGDMNLCDDDETSAIVKNREEEYYALVSVD